MKQHINTITFNKHSVQSVVRVALATAISLGGLGAVGCSAQIAGETEEGVSHAESKLTMGFSTVGCSIAENERIFPAMSQLVADLGSNFLNFQACVNSTPLVEFSCGADQGRERIIDNLLATSVTKITCKQLAPNVLGEAFVSVAAGQLSIDHGFATNASSNDIAATIVHELMHNWGYTHSQNPFGSQFYPNTVPEQVEACVRDGVPNASQGALTLSFDDRCDGGAHTTLRQNMHACPVGMYMTGVHLNSNHFLCKSFPGNTYQPFQELIDTNTSQFGMHNCPTGFAMTGLHYNSNRLLCAPFAQGARSVDNGTLRQGLHACPVGQVQTGLHGNNNQLTCAP